MVNFFDNLRFWHEKRIKLLDKIKIYSIINYIIYIISNAILPIYFRITCKKQCYSITNENLGRNKKIIVSLTSFPQRITVVHLTIESILHQTMLPDKIILWLSEQQFPKKKIPERLSKLTSRGVEIRFVDGDLRSHKKYYYAMKEFIEDIIITIDDDIYYRNDLIENLIFWHNKYPEKIIANWLRIVKLDLQGNSTYRSWPEATKQGEVIFRGCAIGCAGVLYPPYSLYEDVCDENLIKELCLTADDIWLASQASLKHTDYVFTNYKQHHLSVRIHNNITLLDQNRIKNQQVVEAINKYYKQSIGIVPLS